ncbi:MAG: hypothetical protein HC817_09315 [Saprospiraceae bacterium]|nr:hypothetical protein [Saprospiraceae bacterium]
MKRLEVVLKLSKIRNSISKTNAEAKFVHPLSIDSTKRAFFGINQGFLTILFNKYLF